MTKIENLKTLLIFCIIVFGLFGLAKSPWAADLYFGQALAGGNNGSDCANHPARRTDGAKH